VAHAVKKGVDLLRDRIFNWLERVGRSYGVYVVEEPGLVLSFLLSFIHVIGDIGCPALFDDVVVQHPLDNGFAVYLQDDSFGRASICEHRDLVFVPEWVGKGV